MPLPSPLPDNPSRWDGWRSFNSDNLYERLGLSFDSNPSTQQIEDNCRQLLVWWQKKLPLKNQPSNPMAQILRVGLDEAPRYLIEARTELLNPVARARLDEQLRLGLKHSALEEFQKYLNFVLSAGVLSDEDEANLIRVGEESGLLREEIQQVIEEELEKRGAKRKSMSEEGQPAMGGGSYRSSDPATEFRRMLELSGLGDEEDMTDDQRDAFCNMGENLGLTGGQAEDIIDEYLEAMTIKGAAPAPVKGKRPTPTPGRPTPPSRGSAPATPPPTHKSPTIQPRHAPQPPPAPAESSNPSPAAPAKPGTQRLAQEIGFNITPLARAAEKEKNPNFHNSLNGEMFLVTSGTFMMGSDAPDASPNEKPATRTSVSCFYISRFPITNAQYEIFDATHREKRAAWADDNHPVVHVSQRECAKFCEWLSKRDGRRYRLPTEAEWEYAARGLENRIYPWGPSLSRGDLANFADSNTNFAWRDPLIDDGYAQSSPVGSYPLGASPFGIEEMAGNVWEWCQDFFELYKGMPRANPRGPTNGVLRVHRGGSWKSRAHSLRSTCRSYNQSEFSSNDVGFRVVCGC